MDALTLAQLKAAFLALNSSEPGHAQVVRALDKKYDGFAPARDRDYDVIRTLIAPFDAAR